MEKGKQRIVSLLLTIFLVVGMVGVISIDAAYAASKKNHLRNSSISVIVGKTYQQKLINKRGKIISATKIKWKSSKPSIAKINKKGKITAVKTGTVKMTAKYKGKTYKFTVKVKKPFASGEKPKITIDYDDDDRIDIMWDELKNAKKYQIYVSTNGGKFVLKKEWEWSDYTLYNPVWGNTYSFKVRAVSGKYYSEFSTVKTINFVGKTAYFYLKGYIEKYGTSNKYGGKTLWLSDETDMQTYVETDNHGFIYFGILQTIETSESIITAHMEMEMRSNDSNTYTPFYLDYVMQNKSSGLESIIKYASVDLSSRKSYDLDTDIKFDIEECTKIDTPQSICNSELKLALQKWNRDLLSECGFGLSRFGFKCFS